MSTYVLPLWDSSGSITKEKPTYSLDNLNDLIDHIDNNTLAQQSLEIDSSIGYGVWETLDKNYVVAAELNTSWGDLLNLPHLDEHLQWHSCSWKPTEQQWILMRQHIARQLSSIIESATGTRIDASRVRYSIRRKQSTGAKIYKVFTV